MTIKIRRDRFSATVIEKSKPLMRAKATELGKVMVDIGTQYIRDGFVVDRIPSRRRDTGVRLVNALRYEVTEEGNKITVALTTKRGVSDVKVRVANNGAAAHVIRPKGRFLVFPGNRGTIRGSGAQLQTGTRRRTRSTPGAAGPFSNAYSSDRSGRAKAVYHPGRSRTARGTRFMQRARTAAVNLMR